MVCSAFGTCYHLVLYKKSSQGVSGLTISSGIVFERVSSENMANCEVHIYSFELGLTTVLYLVILQERASSGILLHLTNQLIILKVLNISYF